MRILILGGAGFLGGNLVRRCLRDAGNRVLVIDSLEPQLESTLENLDEVKSSIQFVQGDLRDAALMRDVVKGQDIIFNCAAQTSHPLSMSDPLLDAEINSIGNLTLLEAVREQDKNRETVVLYPSTSTVLGAATRQWVDETDPEDPLDIYSADKSVAEKYYRIYHRAHGLKTVVLRFANLYGPYGKGSPAFGFANYFIHLAWKNEDITVYGSGAQKRNLLYAEDAAEVFYQCAFKPELAGSLLFAVHHEHFSILEFAHQIVATFERGRVVNIDWPDDRRRIEIGDAMISGAKLSQVTGWQPSFSLKEGLVRTRQTMEAMQRA